MRRRRFLATIGTSALLAGCNENTDPSSDTPPRETTSTATLTSTPPVTSPTKTATRSPTEQSTPSPTPTPTTTGMETPTPRDVGPGETRLQFGEWYSFTDFRATVSELTLTTTFRLDDSDTTHEMPLTNS